MSYIPVLAADVLMHLALKKLNVKLSSNLPLKGILLFSYTANIDFFPHTVRKISI